MGTGALRDGVQSQPEAKLAEAQQKAMLKGEAFPDIPMTLYEAIVRDYTGRTPEAREQTLIVTHLNEDRRVLNSMIHDAREKAGELGKEQVMVPVLNTANIRDGELRRLSRRENPDALARWIMCITGLPVSARMTG